MSKPKTKWEDCSNMACYRGAVVVRGKFTPEGEPATEICQICHGEGQVEAPDVDRKSKPG